jgi:lipopolysaccharide biosynthesis glycosyltransferase
MRIGFIYLTDSKGFDLAILSALSVGLSQPPPCHIHIFCYKFKAQLPKSLLEVVVRLGMHFSFDQVEDADAERHQTHGHVTTPTLLKLRAAAQLASDYDRLVVLDNDILVFQKLEINVIPFGAFPVAAVTDMDLSDTGMLRNTDWHSASSRTANTGDYFNAGMMIFATKNWRDEFLEKYSAGLNTHDIECHYKIRCTSIDQCALNSTFAREWVKLSASYNMQAGAKFTRSWKTAPVRHYCGPRKFVPLAAFRNDGRDIKYLNVIHGMVGRPTSKLALAYGLLHCLNSIRNYRSSSPMRNFIVAHERQFGCGLAVNKRIEDTRPV